MCYSMSLYNILLFLVSGIRTVPTKSPVFFLTRHMLFDMTSEDFTEVRLTSSCLFPHNSAIVNLTHLQIVWCFSGLQRQKKKKNLEMINSSLRLAFAIALAVACSVKSYKELFAGGKTVAFAWCGYMYIMTQCQSPQEWALWDWHGCFAFFYISPPAKLYNHIRDSRWAQNKEIG